MRKNLILIGLYPLIIAGVLLFISSGCKKKKNSDDSPVIPATVTDYDGNVYHTLTLGTQVWLIENLHVTHYRDGSALTNVSDNTAWSTLTTGAYCYYLNTAGDASVYGNLYNWYAVADSRNIAPTGWHVATDADWTALVSYLGGTTAAGGKMKETGTAHWITPNTGASNSSGFTGLPGGDRVNSPTPGKFDLITNYGCWWTSTSDNTTTAWGNLLYYGSASNQRGNYDKTCGMSVRCVMN